MCTTLRFIKTTDLIEHEVCACLYVTVSLGASSLVALVALGRGRKRKERLQLCLWNLNICIKKVDVKC